MLDRRFFLAALAAGLASPWRAVAAWAEETEAAPRARRAPDNGGYGPLVKAGPHLALPPGFRYVTYGETGTSMSDGRATPGRHDGMAAFPGPNGTVRLVRNHEVDRPGAAFGPRPYDLRAGGGTTTVVFDPRQGRFLGSFASLTGTVRNCSGGPTPWGTWLSCEEDVSGTADGFTEPHGYCFEVDAGASEPRDARPLRAMGRFRHEAVAVGLHSGFVYETEDRPDAGFYRFIPAAPGRLRAGGKLQMLAIQDQPGYDTRQGQRPGHALPVTWVDIPEPDAPGSDPDGVFRQGRTRGGAVFARLEGCCYGQGRVFFTATTGGDARLGQLWAYRPGHGGGELVLVLESPGDGMLKNPDNVNLSSTGGLVLCEDGPGPDRLLGLDPQGRLFEFARNLVSPGEFAGVTFSPGGKWLFVNIQDPGVTLAITGPWPRGPL